MANKTITINISEELLAKIEESAKMNFRKRGPEINVAIAYYLAASEAAGAPLTLNTSNEVKEKHTEHVSQNTTKVKDTKNLLA